MNLGWLDLSQIKLEKSRELRALALLELCWKEQRPPLYAELKEIQELRGARADR